MPIQLDERKRIILKAIVENYISSGEPVGSRTLAKTVELSPATLRNEMADLEDLNLLEQPHVSAGRIPSDKGYRYYVENIMPRPIVPQDERLRLKTLIEEKSQEANKLVREIADLYARLINYTVFALPPEMKEEVVLRGITNFLNFPEYNDISKAKRVLDFLDDENALKQAITTISENETEENFNVIIGDENAADAIKDCSIIVSKYRTKDDKIGKIGIIGPKRMDYSKAAATLDLITKALGDVERNS